MRLPALLLAPVLVLAASYVVAPPADAAALPTCHGRLATIVGTPGNDHLVGTPGDDVIVAGTGWDTIEAGAGDDVVCGDKGGDKLFGGLGADLLDGGFSGFLYAEDEVPDVLVGGPGDDDLIGGPGVFPGEAGVDVVRYRGSTGPLRLDLRSGTARLPGETDHVEGIEVVTGTRFDDVIIGNGANNELYGFRGDDVLKGAGANDLLYAGRGDDRLFGGTGWDWLLGEQGRDAAYGGPSGDRCAEVEVAKSCHVRSSRGATGR
jgi:Ca2+-binding RTX toxin-like protein